MFYPLCQIKSNQLIVHITGAQLNKVLACTYFDTGLSMGIGSQLAIPVHEKF